MIVWRRGVVTELGKSWGDGPGRAQELRCEIMGDDGAVLPAGSVVRALAYPDVVGKPEVGDELLLNCSALARGLGTGGYALVVANASRLPSDPPSGPGHLVKARYTPLQQLVLGVDEQESPHHDVLADADDLAGLPVVVADLHSALPAIIAGARFEAARTEAQPPRVAYLMTDGGSLPAAFSRTVATLRDAGWLAATITVGQAFGGDVEAVSVQSGLLAARDVLGVDFVVVAQGPGNLGTGTKWGFSGVSAGEAINAASVLGGRPIASLRVSGADERPRHWGVSHHSLTAYGRVALRPADVVVPVPAADVTALPGWGAALTAQVAEQAASLCPPHRLVEVPVDGALMAALAHTPVRLSTMGRGLDADPASFAAAAAAGVWAQELVKEANRD